MFERLTIRGARASMTWGYHTAATMRAWSVTRTKDGWALQAGIDRADRFLLGRKPLIFTAPRRGGFFCFPVKAVTVGREALTATLGPPEH